MVADDQTGDAQGKAESRAGGGADREDNPADAERPQPELPAPFPPDDLTGVVGFAGEYHRSQKNLDT